MSESKYKPGPWKFERVARPVRHWLVHIDGDYPMVVGRSGGPDDVHEHDGANARLIAASPEMYEALRKIAFEPFGPADATAEQVLNAITELARAVLEKAEGKS